MERKILFAAVFVCGITGVSLCQPENKDNQSERNKLLATEKDKISYSVGRQVGANLKNQFVEVNSESFMAGVKDSLDGSSGLMTEQEMNESLNKLTQDINVKRAAVMKKESEKNKAEGEKFLAANKKKKGVKTRPSGLQYKIITAGKGASPKATDTVEVHYSGTLVNGTEFDSSYRRGSPAVFAVNGVISGWTEALQMMNPGAKWEIYIPSQLAYGAQGAGNVIGPDSVLIFTVELLSIKK